MWRTYKDFMHAHAFNSIVSEVVPGIQKVIVHDFRLNLWPFLHLNLVLSWCLLLHMVIGDQKQKTKQNLMHCNSRYVKMSELHQKILEWILAGNRTKDIVKRFMVHRNTILHVRKVYEATGDTVNWPRSSRPCSVRTTDKINEVRVSIKEEPATSIHKLTREHNMSVMSMSDLVRKALKLKSLAKQKVQLLMPLQMQKHVSQGQKIRNFLKSRL